jgi:hypothetical protein
VGWGGGADSPRRETNDVTPFQNLFSDTGSGGGGYMNEKRRAFSCIGYPMACTVAGPHGPGFLPRRTLERTLTRAVPGLRNTRLIYSRTYVKNSY